MHHERWSDRQQRTTVTVDGHDLEVAYRDGAALDDSSGSGGDDAPPVVFLHGIPTWSYLWRRITPPLESDVRTIVPDLVGYGNSDRRDCFDRSLRAQEQALAGLLDHLGAETVHLVGHDIGGGVALRYAAHTDRVGKLVLSNATCYDSWPVEYIATLGLPSTQEMADDAFEDALDEAFVGGLVSDPDPEWTEGIAAPWRRGDGKRAFARAAVATNTNHTTEIDYGAVDADLLCLWGAEDDEQPVEDGRRLVDDVGGEVVALDGAGHWVTEDRPEAYRSALAEFLDA